MGKNKKKQPDRLPEKLLQIRLFLKLSQESIFIKINPDKENAQSKRSIISGFESGRRAPSLIEVFMYAELVRSETKYKNFSSDDLISDDRELPWN